MTVWGPESGHLRLGIDWQFDRGIDANTDGVNITVIYTLQSVSYGHNFSATLNLTGGLGGSRGFSFYSPSNSTTSKEIYRETQWVGTSFSEDRTLWYGGYLSGVWNGSSAHVDANPVVGRRPYYQPHSPTNLRVTYVSDTQADLVWDLDATDWNGGYPVDTVFVDRWDQVSWKWVNVATLGFSKNWTDTSLGTNNRYSYRVISRNPSGLSANYSNEGHVNTTPAAPTDVTAVKNADGASIAVTWTNRGIDQDGLWVWHALGGVWDASPIATLGGDVTSWTDTSPSPSATHAYRLQAVSGHEENQGDLVGPLSATSNTVQLLAAPNAPGGLSPNGATMDVAQPAVLAWVHSPVDSSAQTSAEVRRRAQGTTTWTTLPVVGSVQQVSLAAGTLGVGGFEWQARTRGAYHPDAEDGFGPWSAVAVFTVAAAPTVLINSPGAAEVVTVPQPVVEWGYYQQAGSPQVAWQMQVLTGAGMVVDDRTVSGAASSSACPVRLSNGASYRLRLRVQAGNGLRSAWQDTAVTVTYAAPLVPQVTVSWDATRGAAVVEIMNPSPQVMQVQVDAASGRPYTVEA